MSLVDLTRKQPLYDQLFDILRDKIQNDMAPGDLLPSERQLSQQYGLSRTTVRLALDSLEKMGLVTRRHGKGTYVSDARHSETDPALCYSFTEEMRRLGKTPKTQVLSFSQEEANKSVSSALGLHLGATVWHLHRLRLADDEPMLVGHTYLPLEMFGSLTHEKVISHSLYDLLESEFDQTIKTAEEEVRVMTARAADADLLLIPEGSPVLEISRLTYNAAGRIIEFTRSSARVDKFKYHVIHSRG